MCTSFENDATCTPASKSTSTLQPQREKEILSLDHRATSEDRYAAFPAPHVADCHTPGFLKARSRPRTHHRPMNHQQPTAN